MVFINVEDNCQKWIVFFDVVQVFKKCLEGREALEGLHEAVLEWVDTCK